MSSYRKFAPVWARELSIDQVVETIEGKVLATAGDYLCRGVLNELWPQSESRLFARYSPSGIFDNGWQRFDPKSNIAPIMATEVSYPFRLDSRWGQILGKPHDFVIQSPDDPSDMWVVDKKIFELSYKAEEEKNS
ncbi:MAG: hypothetical protein AAGA30_15955 [Planctomycetota bacterium]